MTVDFMQINKLINYYNKLYELKFKMKSVSNRNSVKYMLADILQDISIEEAFNLIRYYIKIETKPSLIKFCYEYDELYDRYVTELRDLNERKILLDETKKRVEEFRKKYNNDK